ncbi:MAG: diacylglycerol kinase family protein [Chloroflexota bacterium]
MSAKVILNPYSGRWKALRLKDVALAALRAAGIEFDLAVTERPEHGIELAEQAARDGYRPIISAGGDGATGEVINGLLRANPSGPIGPLGVMPLGTANDLVHNLGLPLDLNEAARVIAAGKTRRIDLGKVNTWVFDNNSAVGLEPVVTIHNIRLVRLKGTIRYLVAAVKAIMEKPSWVMRLEWDDGHYEGPVSLVSVGNCPVTGGLFRMAPAADPADGMLTFVFGYAPTRRRMFALLPRTISGDFVNDPAMHQHHARRLVIHTTTPSPLQVDGELRAEAETDFTYECLPGRLDILTP